MRVDVADIGRCEACVFEGQLHARDRAGALGLGGGDVVGVGRRRAAGDLGVDACPAGDGPLLVLEDEGRRTFGDDESVAPGVEGP